MSTKSLSLLTALLYTVTMSFQIVKAAEKEVKFDAANLTYSIGGKQLKINSDATVTLTVNGKKMVPRLYFFIATPFKYWQTNDKGEKKMGEYDGKRIEVRDIKVEGGKVKVKGLVPWNKPEEKLLAGEWSLTVVPNDHGKFEFYYTFEIPEGLKRRDCGIFMTLSNVRQVDAGNIGTWIPKDKKNIHSFKPTVLKVIGNAPEEYFFVESLSWTTQNDLLRFNFRLGKSKNQPSFVIDLGK